jgi:hypothetical protein
MDNSKMLVQALKGNKAQIVLAFLFARTALDVQGLQCWTGLERHTLNDCLRALEAIGLVSKQRGEHGRQVWLTASDLLFQMEGKLPSAPLSSSRGRFEGTKKNKLPPLPESRQMEGKLPSAEVLAALDAAEIREPKRSMLARLEHVTLELISAHVEQVRSNGQDLGLAIYRIEQNWPMPVKKVSALARFIDRRDDDDEDVDMQFKPVTIEELKQDNRVQDGECMVCHAVGDVASVRDGLLCIEHFNAWRFKSLGFGKLVESEA